MEQIEKYKLNSINDYDKIINYAKKKNKKIIIYYYGIWKVPCKEINNQLDDINQISDDIFISIDSDMHYGMLKKNNIKKIPTFIILDHNENILARSEETDITKIKSFLLENLKVKNYFEIKSDEEYNNLLKKSSDENKIIVADFYADWCGPCKRIAPFFKMASEQSDGLFIKINSDNSPNIIKKFNIKGLPTFKIFKKGNDVDTMVGGSVKGLQDFLNKNFN